VRIVLDTSALIAALRSSAGAAASVLELIFQGDIILCMDFKLACEYRDVAMRPAQRQASALSVAETERLISRLEQFAEAVDVIERHRPLSIDPADDMVLDVAINGRVDVIVTNNMKHLHEPGARFGISILTPGAFLQRLAEEK
jgi:putative PIN family toxin of toxin-antitoxin system